jgi:hypothetical protein
MDGPHPGFTAVNGTRVVRAIAGSVRHAANQASEP